MSLEGRRAVLRMDTGILIAILLGFCSSPSRATVRTFSLVPTTCYTAILRAPWSTNKISVCVVPGRAQVSVCG